jgi:hypothetical protein
VANLPATALLIPAAAAASHITSNSGWCVCCPAHRLYSHKLCTLSVWLANEVQQWARGGFTFAQLHWPDGHCVCSCSWQSCHGLGIVQTQLHLAPAGAGGRVRWVGRWAGPGTAAHPSVPTFHSLSSKQGCCCCGRCWIGWEEVKQPHLQAGRRRITSCLACCGVSMTRKRQQRAQHGAAAAGKASVAGLCRCIDTALQLLHGHLQVLAA